MSAAKTAKFLNGLLQTQKADRTRIKELEARLAEVDIRQVATVAAAVKTAETRLQAQLDQVQQGYATERAALAAEQAALAERHAAELAALTELVTNKDWQITELTQQVRTTRQLLAAADASNLELQGTIEALGESLDRATRAAADLADDRAEVTKQREALEHLLDDVREHMRKKDLERERAILNRQALSRAVPGINRR